MSCQIPKFLAEARVETPFGSVGFRLFETPLHREKIRAILEREAGKAIGELAAVEGSKPQFLESPFSASWSHSGNFCALAFSSTAEVGIDLEVLRPRENFMKLAERFFCAEEVSLLEQLGGEVALREFFKLWCRKEALFKCAGGTFFGGALSQSALQNFDGKVFVTELEIEGFACSLAAKELDRI